MDIDIYKTLKFFHIVFFTTWMAGLFYLPRLYVYHSQVKKKTVEYKRFITMESKLLRYIMNPSFILTWIMGISLATQVGTSIWLGLKLICMVGMSGFHMYCVKIRKDFETGTSQRDERHYRIINEIPTVLFLIIIFLAVFKPYN